MKTLVKFLRQLFTKAEKLPYFAHQTAIVESGAMIGRDTKVWHFAHVRGL